MDREEFLAKERLRQAIYRKESKERRIAWRVKFRMKQLAAIEKAKIMLESKSLSRIEWDEIYDALHNNLGPRADQIKRVDKLWVKYKVEGEKQ
jgi:hypothetical protein